MRVLRQLGPTSREEAYLFCESQPAQCTYIAGWIREGGLVKSGLVSRAWLFGESARGRLAGLVYVSSTGIVIPALRSPTAFEDVADMARTNVNAIRVIVGERSQVSELWPRLAALGLRARIMRDQLGYEVDRAGFRQDGLPLELETATSKHLDQVVHASAAMAREEAQDDPQARNPELFRSRILERLARGRDFIHLTGGQLVFKSNVAALSPLGGQVEGIYTIPSHRRRALGRRGTAAVTTWVLERASRAVLLVNEDNLPARHLYEALGYRHVIDSQTVFVAP